jgi:glycosyltransferase involved in cell wall biosynthesis
MATYNGEKYILGQIKSILDQLSPDDEIIVSDDSSTDNTLTIIKSFNDSRIKVFNNINNSGPVGNFENALVNAKGQYMFLADQDDIWLSEKLNKHLVLHGKYDLVISDAEVIDGDENIIYPSFFKERGSKPGLLNNLIKNSYLGCCMSFNRKIVNYALPFPSGIHMHDWWIGLVAERKGKVFFCNERLMRYVRHGNNVSPTINNSGYSFLEKMNNRITLLWKLLFFSWR